MIWMLVLLVVLIALNAVFACAEIAFISVNDARVAKMAEEGDKRAKRVAALNSQPAKFLATIQVAITLSGFLNSALAADNFAEPLTEWLLGMGVPIPRSVLNTLAVVVITLVLSYLTLIFGELVPKRVAMRKADALALGMSGLISTLSRLCAPLVWLLSASTNGVLRLLGIDPNETDEDVSEEDIRMMVDAGGEKGAIDREEQTFIQNVFAFDDLTAGEIATHRTDVDLLWMDEDMAAWEQTIQATRHTRSPVCEDSADHIVGILNARDYFRLTDRSREAVLASAIQPAYFVPESVKADVLFRNMRREHCSLAVVLDEYGGMSGIVTLNDLVEQLVGDLEDDTPTQKVPPVEDLGDGVWRVQGSAELEDVETALGLSLPEGDYDTFSGLVFDALGQVPRDGTQMELSVGGLSIQVENIQEHQVQSALVWKLPAADAEQEQASAS